MNKEVKKWAFPRSFWVANSMELFERWAYYGLFTVLAIYLTASTDTGALGFTQLQKGKIMGTFGALVYLLPVFAGALADRIGYKKVLLIAYIILAIGYYMVGQVHSYTNVFLVFMFVAVGASLFKPVVSATIAKTTHEGNASIGFGIFYMIVNVGAFIGPIAASLSREKDWKYVFIFSSAVIAFNLILLIFFKEPISRKKDDISLGQAFRKILENIWSVLSDIKFLTFLLIIVGFWTMYLQLFFTLPNFIDQWLKTEMLYDFIHKILPSFATIIGTNEGRINPEMLVNIDALYIVIFQIIISSIVLKYRPLNAMISGIFICSIGLGLWFVSRNPFYLFVTIWIFAIGEMSSSPKITEYLGRIAPPDKVGLYMGMSYLPLAGGYYLAGWLSGVVYGNMSDKLHLLSLELNSRHITLPEISATFTKSDYWQAAQAQLHMNAAELTTFLWQNYHPSNIWMVFTGIGLLTTVLLFIYDRRVMKN